MRLQLFEFTDLDWYPAFLKQPIQRYLDYVSARFRIYLPARMLLVDALKASGAKQVVDLGSGAGGGLDSFWEDIQEDVKGIRILRTDRFPVEAPANTDKIPYWPESVDATAVPPELAGFRTMFALAHHLTPAALTLAIQDAQRKSVGLAIFEPVQRGIIQIVLMVLIVPLLVLLLSPFIRPVHPVVLVFTYLIPFIPLTITWDGVVSSLRAYTPQDLLKMARSTDGPLKWKSGYAGPGGRLVYLIGEPGDDH